MIGKDSSDMGDSDEHETGNIDKNNIILLNNDDIFDLIFKSYKNARNKRVTNKELEHDDFLHILGIINKNLSGYQQTIKNNIHLILRPLPGSEKSFYSFFGINDGSHDKFRMGYAINALVDVGDSCVYGRGFDGVRFFMKKDIGELGKSAYQRSSNAFRWILNDKKLTELIEDAGFDPEKETIYFDKCVDCFDDYVHVLREFSKFFNASNKAPKVGSDERQVKDYDARHNKSSKIRKIEEEDARDAIDWVVKPTCKSKKKIKGRQRENTANLPMTVENENEIHFEFGDEIKYISDKQREISFSLVDFDTIRAESKKRIIGQDEAIDDIVDKIILEAVGANDETRPLNFLAIGPTGVGKNYTFEVVSDEISKNSGLELIYRTVNCSSLKSEGSSNQLVGSPKGYIGYKDKGILTSFYEVARQTALRVLLFDEFEKGNSAIMDLLLPALDKGGLYDTWENYIDLTGTWLAFTSNLGYSDLRGKKQVSMGFSNDRDTNEKNARRESIEDMIKNTLSPEFINRVNIIHFNYLDETHMDEIFDLEFKKLTGRLEDKYSLDVEYTQEAKEKILGESLCYQYGARYLKNLIESSIAAPISRKIHGDLQIDKKWAREMLDYLDDMKYIEGADVDVVRKSIRDFGSPKLPYDKLYVDFSDGEFHVKDRF